MYHIVVRNQGRHKAITSKGKVYYASLQKDIKLKFCLNSVAMGTRKKTKKVPFSSFLLSLQYFVKVLFLVKVDILKSYQIKISLCPIP